MSFILGSGDTLPKREELEELVNLIASEPCQICAERKVVEGEIIVQEDSEEEN